MHAINIKNILEICRKRKEIFTLGNLDRDVVNFSISNYTVYIINNELDENKIQEIISDIKEGQPIGAY